MIVIEGYSADELFIKIAQQLLRHGNIVRPRQLETRELRDVFLTLHDPTQCIVTLPERAINHNYLDGEMRWYESGSLDVAEIAKISSFWQSLADDRGKVNSNYGYLAYFQQCPNGQSQFDWCVQKIRSDADTRQALIVYNQPMHKYADNKDFVCAASQFFRQHDGVIDCTVYMRSNDVIYGLSYDLPWFVSVHQKICEQTGYKLGVYQHFTSSLHVYQKHYAMLRNMARFPSIETEIVLLQQMNEKLKNVKTLQTHIQHQQFPIATSSLYGDDDIGWERDMVNGIEEFRFYIGSGSVSNNTVIIYAKSNGDFYIGHFDWQQNRVVEEKIGILEIACIVSNDTIQKCLQLYSGDDGQ